MNLIKTAVKNGQNALSEFESKCLLSSFGIPVTKEILVQNVDEALKAAQKIGFPVVLKACSWELMHKSELDCIELGITNEESLCKAYTRLLEKINIPIEGILVQEMVKGQRELVMGMNRDQQFGPCVMLGFGGVMTEIINDTVFRVAPFEKPEAYDMINELKTKSMLDSFRGQKPADLEAICRTLTAIGKMGMEEESIEEIDINPLIISPEGKVIAVDALIILKREKSI